MSEDGQRDEDRVILEATLQTALEAGVRVQMSGGYTARVYDTMDSLARALGAERAPRSRSSASNSSAVGMADAGLGAA
jgi:uncharacterized membrane protein YjjP (DUF1212 family)